MLKVEMGAKDGDLSLEVCGTALDVTTDVSVLITMIYQRMGIEVRDYFADAITRFMNDGIYKLDGDELTKTVKKKEEDIKKKKNEAKEELFKCLSELLEEVKKMVEEE